MTKKNLIIIHRGPEYEQDFHDIATKVNALDRGITVYHLPWALKVELPLGAWQHPTLTIALTSKFALPIRRGPILRNRAIPKLAQQEMFRSHGIPTPPALPFRFGMKLDPILFGEFVILKPMDLKLTSRGDGISVFRRNRLETLKADFFPASHPIRWSSAGFLVQRFIHTGTFPSNYRATTLLGEVLTLEKFEARNATPPLTASDEDIDMADFSPKTNRAYSFSSDEDVLSLARKVARSASDIPLLGVDIVKDQTGRLFVLEMNAGGNTWHYSSKMWEEHRKTNPEYYESMKNQFGAFDIAARRLCDEVLRQAA